MNLNSGYPFWLIKYGLPYDYPMLQQDIKTDVVIMGGGISGALAAHSLIAAGIDCIVIDQRTIGLGSTCASTSLLQYEIDIPLSRLQHKIGLSNAVNAYKLCEQSLGILRSISNQIGFDGFEKQRSLYYAATKSADKFLKEEYKTRKENGFNVNLAGADEIRSEFNISASSAIVSEDAAQTNAYGFTHALLQYNLIKGLKVFDRTEAVNIDHSKAKVTITTNKKHLITANKLIYATGYEAVKYIKKKIVHLDSTYAVCTEQLLPEEMPMKKDVLMWNTSDPYLYLRNTNDNRIIIGGRDERFYDPVKRDKLIDKKSKQLSNDLKKLFPSLLCKTEFSWTGTFGSTKDGLPFIGEYKNLPNSYFALGFGGNGITFSTIAAAFLTNTIRGIKNDHEDLFSFDRI